MDSASRRVAALQKEAQELSTEAVTLRKAVAGDPKAAARLKEIVVRLKAVESEYTALLSTSPLSAVTACTGGEEVSVLQSENRELRRRNAELEKLVSSLQQFQRQAKDQISQAGSRITAVEDREALLLRRLVSAEREVAAARKEVRAVGPVSAGAGGSWSEDAAQRLAEVTSRIEEMQKRTEGQASRMEVRVSSATKQISQLRLEVAQLRTTLANERNRANGAELLAAELQEEVQNISAQVVEAKKLMQKARAESPGQNPVLREWAQSELQRLKQQLAATTA